MNGILRISLVAATLTGGAFLLSAHPHFRKTVVAKLPDQEIKLEYITYPWNPAHLSEVKEGFVFSCGNATVEFSKPIKIGAQELQAGRYLLRARAKDVDNWTLIVLPPGPDRNTPPDLTKAVELSTKTLTGRPVYDHLLLDITPGHGDTAGKALFVLSWGDRQLEGIIADFSTP
jgi:hypothetical protein